MFLTDVRWPSSSPVALNTGSRWTDSVREPNNVARDLLSRMVKLLKGIVHGIWWKFLFSHTLIKVACLILRKPLNTEGARGLVKQNSDWSRNEPIVYLVRFPCSYKWSVEKTLSAQRTSERPVASLIFTISFFLFLSDENGRRGKRKGCK